MVEVPENFSMNPLNQYLRQPSIYLKLPSGGRYWTPGSLEMPVNGELPILPMSTRDEIMLNTPDALMNGQGVVDVIQSCVPNIKNAWEMPVLDVDAILIAIRIASFGEMMQYTSTCTQCQNADEFEIDLRAMLDLTVKVDEYLKPVDYKGMQIYIKPINYHVINSQNLDQFEQNRLIITVNNADLSEEERVLRFNDIFKNMTRHTLTNIAGSIDHIVTPDGVKVADRQHIMEFIENSERQLFATMKEKIAVINAAVPEKSIPSKCSECGHSQNSPFTFDQANFFAFAS